MSDMRRREFITLVGGAAAWPLAARAQQAGRVYRIGMLMGQPEGDPENASRLAAFRLALGKLGRSEGRNLLIDMRWGAGDPDRMRTHGKELSGLAPDIVVAESTPATAAVRQEVRGVPIVFLQVANPIGAGFVASLARPGGNITGFTNFEPSMGGKWLELLKEVAPATCTRRRHLQSGNPFRPILAIDRSGRAVARREVYQSPGSCCCRDRARRRSIRA
jgi:putative ABC transport system substrate-binding protein